MSRPIRSDFPQALYHVTLRGDRREDMFDDDVDRQAFLDTLAQVVEQFNWLCYAWCLMDNHYHLLIQTPDGNLSQGMRQLDGVFTQTGNRRHHRVGHLFRGRSKAFLVNSDACLLELARCVVSNPLRAGMVKKPDKCFLETSNLCRTCRRSWTSNSVAMRKSALPIDARLRCHGRRSRNAHRIATAP
jgi:REP element-mobilizing transposase RayT